MLELFGQNSSAFVYVYSADADSTGLGRIFYRESTEKELLDTASEFYNAAFHDVNFTSLFVATWFYLGYFDSGTDLVCTVVLVKGVMIISISQTCANCTLLIHSWGRIVLL